MKNKYSKKMNLPALTGRVSSFARKARKRKPKSFDLPAYRQVRRREYFVRKIKKIVNEFQKIDPEKVILFGSAAKGKVANNSDIDICVIKKTADTLKLKRQLREIIWRKKIGFEPEIELHVYTPQVYLNWLKRKDPFISEIEKGKIVYER